LFRTSLSFTCPPSPPPQEYSQSIERGRTASVASLREKFDRKAKENTERLLAETKRNKFRKRSASLEPTPSPDDIQRKDSKELRFEDEVPEIRGRRSRRLSVESYFHSETGSLRAHSLSPVPPPPSIGTDTGDHMNTSPPRQRAMAIICQPPNGVVMSKERVSPTNHSRYSSSRNRSDAIASSNQHQNHLHPSAPSPSTAAATVASDVNSAAPGGSVTISSSPSSASPSPRVGVEYEFLLKYKPDNENKVHFTKRELLALRLLFSLFDR
jgi:hypothetical protein